MDFERRTLPAQPYLYVEGESPYEGEKIAAAMGAAFGKVFGFVAEAGISPLSAPITVYLGMDPSTLRFRSGVMVSAADAAKADAGVLADELPGGEAMATVHVGPYGKMNETHQALWNHMEEHAIEGAMPVWEVYVDDPEETDEAELRTEIYRAIA